MLWPRGLYGRSAPEGVGKGTGNALLLLAITVGSDGHRFDPRWVNLDRMNQGFFCEVLEQHKALGGADAMALRLGEM